jgi:ABC-type glycerol-3-phosphate transport system substrate-binding protein
MRIHRSFVLLAFVAVLAACSGAIPTSEAGSHVTIVTPGVVDNDG